MPRLRIVPLDLKTANAWVAQVHRHHKPSRGHKFSIGCENEDGVFVGAVIVGRPVARNVNGKVPVTKHTTIEVARLATDGTRNACSLLYAAAARAAAAMGYRKIQTYILKSEPGTSLKAAGWQFDADVRGEDWNRPSRGGRRTDQPTEDKQRWIKELT
jgi:hypothetical protein